MQIYFYFQLSVVSLLNEILRNMFTYFFGGHRSENHIPQRRRNTKCFIRKFVMMPEIAKSDFFKKSHLTYFYY